MWLLSPAVFLFLLVGKDIYENIKKKKDRWSFTEVKVSFAAIL